MNTGYLRVFALFYFVFIEMMCTVSCPISGHFLQNCNILPHNSTNELKFSHSVASTAGK